MAKKKSKPSEEEKTDWAGPRIRRRKSAKAARKAAAKKKRKKK